MEIKPKMTVSQLVDEMDMCGVLGAGRLGKAVEIIVDMFEDKEYTTFLCVAGPMAPGGLRNIMSLLIERGYVDAVVTSGANIVHDIVESLGFKGVKGSFTADDLKLRSKDVGRAGDIFFGHKGFEALEKENLQSLRLTNG